MISVAYKDILERSDRTLYVGSTRNREARLWQHQMGEGAIYGQTRLPVRLLLREVRTWMRRSGARSRFRGGVGRRGWLSFMARSILPGLSKKKFG